MNYGKLTPNGGLVFAPRGKGRSNDHESLISKGYLPVVYTEAPQIENENYRIYPHWENTGTAIVQEWEVVFFEFALSDEGQYLFDKIDEINVRDGDNYGNTDSDFGFSVWTTIEECLQPPVIWEKSEEFPEGHWFCTEPFSEPEIFNFPDGIGDVEVVNVEHEEVLLVPREIDCNRVTFKYGVPREFRAKLLTLHGWGLDNKRDKIKVGDSEITPRDFVCKVIPSPVGATDEMTGKGCAGSWVTGWKDGKYRSVYLYQVADNQECIKKYTTNSVVAQTAVGPVIMMELIAKGIWNDAGAWGPEHFDPDPFVERLAKYDFPAGIREMDSEYADELNAKAFVDYIK